VKNIISLSNEILKINEQKSKIYLYKLPDLVSKEVISGIIATTLSTSKMVDIILKKINFFKKDAPPL